MKKLIYFSAPWCGPCKLLGPTMDKSGLPFQKINIDDELELASKYGVRSVPTLLIADSNGNEVKRLVGNHDLVTIKNWYNG